MNPEKHFIYFFCIILLGLGLYFCYYSISNPYAFMEGFDNDDSVDNTDLSCPNILVQNGNQIFLYNSKKVNVPGVNPIKFNHLDEYVEFMEWQKSQNINCPVLFLQHSFDANGFDSYRIRPDIQEPEGGLNPYNELKEDVIIDHDTLTDLSFDEVNPMSDEWKGQEATEKAVLEGDFSGNYVSMNPQQLPLTFS
jgi:hypothetical protein